MKKRLSLIAGLVLAVMLLSGCKSFSVSLRTVGKDNTSALKMARTINEDLYSDKKHSNYKLYAVNMAMDAEGIGTAQLIYTSKLAQNLKYSDITVVTVDTRTGKVESVKDASFASSGLAPYESIVHGAPLQMENWKKDSSDARTIAQNTFAGETNFVYNYITIYASVVNSVEQYEVTFISFVNQLKYVCVVDGMTGAVLSKEIMSL